MPDDASPGKIPYKLLFGFGINHARPFFALSRLAGIEEPFIISH
jgi:hypothetical protein